MPIDSRVSSKIGGMLPGIVYSYDLTGGKPIYVINLNIRGKMVQFRTAGNDGMVFYNVNEKGEEVHFDGFRPQGVEGQRADYFKDGAPRYVGKLHKDQNTFKVQDLEKYETGEYLVIAGSKNPIDEKKTKEIRKWKNFLTTIIKNWKE